MPNPSDKLSENKDLGVAASSGGRSGGPSDPSPQAVSAVPAPPANAIRVCSRGHLLTPENTQRIGKAGPRCKQCRRRIARESARRTHAVKRASANKELMEQPMTEAEKYTVEMWQHHLGQVINLVLGTEKRRRAFIDGFNGLTVDEVHYTGRSAWERGRQSAVLLGYIPASGIEAASADETRSGSAEGESPTAEGRDVQGSDLSRLTPSKE